MERQQFIDNELENYIKQFPDATDTELDDILMSASKTFDANQIQTQPIVSTPMPEPQPQAVQEPQGITPEIRQTLAPEIEPNLSLFQRFAGGPVGDALAGIGNIARQSQTVSPEVLAIAQQQTVIPTKEEVAAQLINNATQGAQAIRNVPTALGGLAGMVPSFATDLARGATDIVAGGAEMLGGDQLAQRIREEGKLAADTAKQLAAESTANIRQFYEGKPTDVEGEMLAEELQPAKKQGAFARAMRTKFLFDAENMSPEAFKAKYPEALPIDEFNARFEEVLSNQSLPQTIKSFFFDMPMESIKTVYGAISGDPETLKRFRERPAETFVETGIGLGIGARLSRLPKDIKSMRTFKRLQTQAEAAVSFMTNERAMTDFLRKNNDQRNMSESGFTPQETEGLKFNNIEKIRNRMEAQPLALPDYSFEMQGEPLSKINALFKRNKEKLDQFQKQRADEQLAAQEQAKIEAEKQAELERMAGYKNVMDQRKAQIKKQKAELLMRQWEELDREEKMLEATGKGMTVEEQAATIRETPNATEPAPQNMEQTTEFLTRKPAVTIGEAEQLQGEAIPEGRGGMTIGPRRPAVTFGGKGERTGEAIPESKGMTVQPTAPTNKLDQLFKRESTTPQPKKEYGYLMNARPFSIGAQPKGQVRVNERTDGRYGTIYYDRPLTEQEMKSYELKPEGPIVYKDVTDNPFYNDIKDLKVIDTDKSADNILELTGSDKPIFLRNGKERIAVITPSAKQKGKFQATKFDERGPIGDAVSSTPKEAIKSLIEDGYKELSNEQEFTELTFDTKETQRQEVIRNINKPSTPSPERQQAPEVVVEDIKPQPIEQTPVKTPKIETAPQPKTGPGMFEGAELQNEEIDWSAPFSRVIIDENDARFIERFKQKGIDINLAKISGSIEKMPKELLTKLAEGYDMGSNAVEALYRYVKGEQKPEIIKYFNDKGEEIQHNPNGWNEIILTITNDGHSISNTPQKGTKAREVIDKILKEHYEKRELDIMQNIAGETTIGTLKDWLKGPDATEMFKDVLDTQVIIRPEGPTNTTLAWVPSDGEAIYLNSSQIKTVGIRYLKNAITHEAQHLLQIKKGQKIGGQNYLPYKERPAEIEAHAVGEKYRTGRLSMFGAGTLQNAYEKVEPALKKGVDALFGKRAKAYEQGKKTGIRTEEDLTKGLGLDITQGRDGKVTETEHRYQPRFIGNKPTQRGAINPSGIIDAISGIVGGKKKEQPFEVTIGDPALAKEFEKTFKATQAAETLKKQTAKAREQSTASAYKQGLVDLFSPVIDRAPKGPEREKVMSIVHDIFYLGAPAEAFMRKTKDMVLDKVNHADYASYMAAKAITTFREHIEKPDRIKLAEDFLKSIDPNLVKQYEKITTEWHENAWKPILEELKASGLDDPLIIDNIMSNENYAPFFPAKQLGLPSGLGENAPGAGIYKLKGGMGDYMDVLAAKMKKGIAMLAAAGINKGKLTAIDTMLQYDKANIKEAMPEYKGYYKERDPLTGKMLEIPMVEFPEPQPGSGLALIEARRDGKKVGYYVPKEIKRAFDMAMGEGDTLGATMRGFQKMTQGFRNVWIEYNPIWQVAVNAPRDIMTSIIEMPKVGNRFKFMGNLAKVAPAAVGDYVPILGKVVQAFTGYDRKKFDKDVTKMLGESKLLSTREPQYLGETDTTVGEGLKRAYGLTEKHTGIAKALDTVQEFGKDIERMTKVAANLTLEGDKRFTDPEVKNIVRQIGSPAFGVRGGGDLFKTIKTATMFYNATKQGWVAAKYFLEKDPVGAIAFASVPMALYASTILAENGTFGDDYKKAYTLMKSYDKENKLNFPIGYKENGEVEYISLPLPQFLKPAMRIMRTAAKENPKYLDSIIKGFSEELPMLNPVVGLINRVTSYGDEKPPAAELSGQEIMTQDQWDAGGYIKGEAFLKAFWNDYLLGSQIRLKVKPSEKNQTWQDRAIRFLFGKVYKTNFNEDVDTSATKQKQAIQRIKTREAAEAETPEQTKQMLQDMMKEGYIPQRGTFKNAKQQKAIEDLFKTNAPAARQIMIYRSSKSREEKLKAFQKLNELLKKKKK